MSKPLQAKFFKNLDDLISYIWRTYSLPYDILSIDGHDPFDDNVIDYQDIIDEIDPDVDYKFSKIGRSICL